MKKKLFKVLSVGLSMVLFISFMSFNFIATAASPGGTETANGGIGNNVKVAQISSCDSIKLSVWPGPGVIATNDKLEGTGSLKLSGGNGLAIWGGGNQLDSGSIGKFDVSSYNQDELALSIWIKVTDISKITYATIKLGTNNLNSDNYVWWSDKTSSMSSIQNNQWTQIVLRFSDVKNGSAGTAKNGSFDVANITHFSIDFNGQLDGCDFYFDNIAIVKLSNSKSNGVAAQVLNCDAKTFGVAPNGIIDTANRIEGKGSLKITGGIASGIWGAGNQLGCGPSGKFDVSSYNADNLALSFWIKATNISKFTYAKIKLASNSYDSNYYLWWASKAEDMMNIENNKWTRVILKFSAPRNGGPRSSKSGNLDMANITNFSFGFDEDITGCDIYLDDIAIIDLSNNFAFSVAEPAGTESISVNACEDISKIDFWAANGTKPQVGLSPFCTQGSNSYSFSMTAGNNVVQMIGMNNTTIDLSIYKQCYFVADIFLPENDVICFSNVSVSYSPDNIFNDVRNMTWWLKKMDNGWNHIVLPFNPATGTVQKSYADIVNTGGGSVDVSGNAKMNQLKFIINSTKSTNINIDNIKILGFKKTFYSYNISTDGANMISKINPGINVTTFLSGTNKGTDTLTVKNKLGTEIKDNEKITTGTTVEVNDGTNTSTYTIIIYGDVYADGNIDVLDLAAMKAHLLKSNPLTGNELKAGKICSSSSVTISDLLAIKKQILNLTIINQNK